MSREREHSVWPRTRAGALGAVLAIFAPVAIAAGLTYLAFVLPDAASASAPATHFSAERAFVHMKYLAGIGVRNVGHPNNEVVAANYILRRIEQLREVAQRNNWEFVTEVQHPRGAVTYEFLYSYFTNAYTDVANILVRVGPPPSPSARGAKRDAVLVSAHYDSTLGTPGAFDDISGIAIMLELLSNIVEQREHHIRRDVIFNFNGAEETFLQAAHGFVTGHPWSRDVASFINLEAAGFNGPAVIFQAGPHNAWLTHLLAEVLPHPHTNVVAQDIFQNNLVPGDTDYRIYRDYAGKVDGDDVDADGDDAPDVLEQPDVADPPVPGVDMAFYRQGHRYHTTADVAEDASTSSLQHMGENAHAIVTALAALEALPPRDADASDAAVFFDVWGRALVSFSARSARLLYAAVLAGVALLLLRAGSRQARTLALAALLHLAAALFTLLVAAMSAVVAWGVFGVCMNWYSRMWLALLIYTPVAVAALIAAAHAIARVLGRRGLAPEVSEAAAARGGALMHAALLLLAAAKGLGGAYIPALLCVSALAASAASVTVLKGRGRWPLRHIVHTTVPMAHLGPLTAMTLSLVLPIIGRVGAAPPVVAELVASGAVAVGCLLLLLPALPFLQYLPLRPALRLAAALFAAGALLSRAYLPYDPKHPKRLMSMHLHRFEDATLVAPLHLDAAAAAAAAASGLSASVTSTAPAVTASSLLLADLDPAPASTTLNAVAAAARRAAAAASAAAGDADATADARVGPLHWASSRAVDTHEPWQIYFPFSAFLLGTELTAVPPDATGVPPPAVTLHPVVRRGPALWNVSFTVDTHEPRWAVFNITGAEVRQWSFNRVRPRRSCPPGAAAQGQPCTYMVRHAQGRGSTVRVWLLVEALPVSVTLSSLDVQRNGRVGDALLRHLPAWYSAVSHLCTLQTFHLGARIA